MPPLYEVAFCFTVLARIDTDFILIMFYTK